MTGFAPSRDKSNTFLEYACRVIERNYGDKVDPWNKGKTLFKFGRTANADSGVRTTVAQFQGAVVNETFATTNSVDRVVSTSTSDNTGTVTIEGHTIDSSGNMTFVVQLATLNGQTPVALTTPLARVTRIYRTPSGSFSSPSAALVGNIYVYDSTVATSAPSGVPSDATATKAMIAAGFQQTEKCATTISAKDYWIATTSFVSITQAGGGPAAKVEFQYETRDVANGGVWRPFGPEISIEAGAQDMIQLSSEPYFIVPKNHDFRVIAISNTANTEVSASVVGLLAEIRG